MVYNIYSSTKCGAANKLNIVQFPHAIRSDTCKGPGVHQCITLTDAVAPQVTSQNAPKDILAA